MIWHEEEKKKTVDLIENLEYPNGKQKKGLEYKKRGKK